MRWVQVTFVENDPQTCDPAFWLDYFKRIKADGAVLSSGGYVAYHPTQIPLHHLSRWLGEGDLFGDMVKACRKMHMAVIARTDPHAVHQDVYEAHPEWIAVDEAGRKRRHWSTPEAWVTCALGLYNFEFMTKVFQEIVSLYEVDGIFANRWAGHGTCYCESCRQRFKEYCDMRLPDSKDFTDPTNPRYRNYLLWRQDRLFALCRLWDEEIRKIRAQSRFIPNSGGGALSLLDMKTLGENSDILFADRQARRGLMPPWAAGKNGKEYRAAMGMKPVGGIFSVGVEEQYRWKDSVQSPNEVRVWVADAVANGLRPWLTKFSATIHDRRWLKVVEDLYTRYHDWEPYLRNQSSLARVAVIYSQQSAWFYGGDRAREKVEDHMLGVYQALVEARVPFEMVHDCLLEPEIVDRFKTLILPNIAALSDDQCQQIRGFVNRGGSLVATYETSLCDEWGNPRSNFGLADLFGVDFTGEREGPMKNSYLHLEGDHPILAGLQEAQRIINGVYRLGVKTREQFPVTPVTLVPAYPDLPMEEVYPRQVKTDIPEVFLRKIEGGGRIAYMPWDIDRSFWEVLCMDHGTLLANTIKWATDEDEPAVVKGPGVLDVAVWRQKSSITVHLVNLTNPMMMKGPIRELYSVGEQAVRVKLGADEQVKGVRLLARGEAPLYTVSDGYLKLTVPTVLDHEVVAIDLEH
jgi:hypothetical protein